MPDSVAVLLLLLGCLTLVGTAEAMAVTPLMRRYAVPTCCRRRVDVFEARAWWTLAGAAAVVVAGVVLLLV
jgi:hypothetical protein